MEGNKMITVCEKVNGQKRRRNVIPITKRFVWARHSSFRLNSKINNISAQNKTQNSSIRIYHARTACSFRIKSKSMHQHNVRGRITDTITRSVG